jgi:phospholipase/lecithinase/hemolysin
MANMLDLFRTNSFRVSGWLYFHPAWGKITFVQKAVGFMVGFLLFGSAVFPAQAAFTNLYVFGDSISSTTDNPAPPGPFYYGKRYSNGRVWVEVLAQRQGLTLYPTNNWSYFGNSSTSMVANVSSFQAPSNASNALFVIWVNNADLWFQAYNSGTSTNTWTNAMNVSLTNHFKAITNLYAKGARTLIMPNVVDLSTIPAFNSSANTNFVHQRCLDYNVAFTNTLNRARTNSNYPGLTIYMPDFFTLLTNILAYPASYSVTNALSPKGHSIDVIDDDSLNNKYTNGPGTNYIFWDPQDPTAKVHMWMGNTAQQLISPVLISKITRDDDDENSRLYLANVPIGQNGLVLGRTNLVLKNWTTNVNFSSTNATQTVFVPSSGPVWFYRLKFLYSWTWP